MPLQVDNEAYDTLPTAELRRRATVNVAVAGAALRATLDFARSHRGSLIADQIEMFRRGVAGAAQVPVSARTVPGVPGIGPEDVCTTEFPRAYTIAADTAGARLVAHLLANDVRVLRAATGAYVVDMHQPKRGLANALLADGRDISGKVSAMYDISAWSLGRLWGATVEPVTALPAHPSPPSPRPLPSRMSPRTATSAYRSPTRRSSRPSTPFCDKGFRYAGRRTAARSCRSRGRARRRRRPGRR